MRAPRLFCLLMLSLPPAWTTLPTASALDSPAVRGGAPDAVLRDGFETGLTTTYVPYVTMPPHDDARMRWITGEVAIVRDHVGGDLVAFFRGNASLYAAVSPDQGDSWHWVDPAAPVDVAMPNTLAQSADGKVHVLSELLALRYSRLALVRNGGGHVVGFGAEVANLELPAPIGFGELRTQLIVGADGAGNPTLFYTVYDWAVSGAHWARIQAGKTSVAAGVAPDDSGDFVSLGGAPGATELARFGGDSPFASPHNNAVQMAQHPVSRDLWWQWGPIDTGDTITSNTLPVVRLRAVPAGPHAWNPGTAQTVDGFAGGYASELGPVVASAHHVWFVRISSTAGVTIDRADAAGVITAAALPSPYPTARLGGWTAFAIDPAETRAWIGGWIAYDSAHDPTTRWVAHWNGTAWTRLPDDAPLSDTNGLGRSAGWNDGLVLMTLDASSAFPYSGRPSFATIRTR